MTRVVGLLILGASARSAAWSALRAGLSPAAADLFGDRDLKAVAACARVSASAYPGGLVDAADGFPPGPWLYTGALENRPDLLDRLERRRPLWGNGAATARAVRDPRAVAEALREAGLPCPEVRAGDPGGLPRDGSWLRKPLASAGGSGITPLGPSDPDARGPSYYQRRVDGLSLSAVFVGSGSGASLAGVTRQLLGRLGAAFAYRGSLAPWPVAADVARRVEAIGGALVRRFGLVGLFGVDLILDDAGRPWPVEVNPRYTASVEVIELALGRSLLDAHRRACEGRDVGVDALGPPARFVAKEILFANAEGVFNADEPPAGWDVDEPFRLPEVGDVPEPGTRFGEGEPVLTVFAEGANPEECLRKLAAERDRWRRRLATGGGVACL